MQKNVKRLMGAAAVSLCGFALTFAWYNFTENDNSRNSKNKPIARMVITKNEVQRKPIQKLIWQPVTENEILHIGEAIRTAADSEATIEFLNSPTRIDLDPDSAIILEESAGQIALNFLQGNLFVRGGEGDGSPADANTSGESKSTITLLSGNKKIALGKSELNLGKSGSGELDLQVLKGQAQVLSENGQTVTIDQGKSLNQQTFKLISPAADEAIYLEKNKNEKVSFKWAPLSADYTVTLEVGPTRNSIKPTAVSASGDSGELQSILKFGRNFYRLVARSIDAQKPELTTVVHKNEVLAIMAPVLLEPEKDKKVIVNYEKPQVRFGWSNPSQYEKVVFEIYRDSDLKQKMFSKVIEGKNEISLDIKNNGQFYWRVSGHLKGRADMVTSELYTFTTDVFKGLQTPLLVAPLANEKVPANSDAQASILFKWEAVTKAKKYKVQIVQNGNQKPLFFESEISQYKAESLKAGDYWWSVQAIDDEDKASLASEKRNFEIVNLPIIQWANEMSDTSNYVTLKPSVDLRWLATTVGHKTYKVRIIDAQEPDVNPLTQLTLNQKLQVDLSKNGDYYIEVEALDSTNKVVARSSRRKVAVQPAPLLPAPLFAQSLPEKMMANNFGQTQLTWDTVTGAKQYVVLIKNKEGVVSRELASKQNEVALKGLMPGEYTVSLKSVDEFGRSGPEGESRGLTVPNTSGVRAPKLKGVKVK